MGITNSFHIWLTSLLFAFLTTEAFAQTSSNTSELLIYNSSSTYHYVGCWNDTAGIAGTSGARALPDISLEQPGTMTVELCLDFCAHNQSSAYKYAGLEYSRQCWCANRLSSISTKLDDGACDTQCDGNQTEACGGALKLSLYNITTAGGVNAAVRAGGEVGALMGCVLAFAAVVACVL